MEQDTQQIAQARQVALGLGWFSVVLGVAELAAPEQLARMIGTRGHSSLLRAYERGADRSRVGTAAAAVAGVTLIDLAVATHLSGPQHR